MEKNWQDIWRFGANFTPSSAINQLEMWQADSFDTLTIDRELGYAQGIGMNIMRVLLHDLLWEQDAQGFLERMEKYLEIAASHGIATMFVFFDDCWNSEFALGKRPAPKPFTHNSGWVQSPGNKAADDLSQRPRLEAYVKGVLTHFAHDKRIALWDLYNEPGNGSSGDAVTTSGLREEKSFPLLKDVFRWAREVEIDQPITVGMWTTRPGFDRMNRFILQQSEVVSFHCYNKPDILETQCDFYRVIADGRPILCSEYMARTAGSTFKGSLPIFKKNNISAINWGLVSGKTQTIYPWGWNEAKGMPNPLFHDVFNSDGTLLCDEDGEAFAALK